VSENALPEPTTKTIHHIVPVKSANPQNSDTRPRIITAISETNIGSLDVIQNDGDKTFIVALNPPMTGTSHTIVLPATTNFVGGLIEALQTVHTHNR
jgi:hypothetical protein